MHVVEPDARPKKVGRILAELKAELEVCWLRILILPYSWPPGARIRSLISGASGKTSKQLTSTKRARRKTKSQKQARELSIDDAGFHTTLRTDPD